MKNVRGKIGFSSQDGLKKWKKITLYNHGKQKSMQEQDTRVKIYSSDSTSVNLKQKSEAII